MTYASIQAKINDLKAGADEELMNQLNILHDQFNRAGAAEWSKDELSDLIKSDSDILDSGVIDEETALWDQVREIQDDIILFFGE